MVITAAHVLDNQDTAIVRNDRSARSEAHVVWKYQDLSVLRIDRQADLFCDSAWTPTEKDVVVLADGKDLSLRWVTGAGSTSTIALIQVKSTHEKILVKPKREGDDALFQGLSGSPVIADKKIVALLTAIDENDRTGECYRETLWPT